MGGHEEARDQPRAVEATRPLELHEWLEAYGSAKARELIYGEITAGEEVDAYNASVDGWRVQDAEAAILQWPEWRQAELAARADPGWEPERPDLERFFYGFVEYRMAGRARPRSRSRDSRIPYSLSAFLRLSVSEEECKQRAERRAVNRDRGRAVNDWILAAPLSQQELIANSAG